VEWLEWLVSQDQPVSPVNQDPRVIVVPRALLDCQGLKVLQVYPVLWAAMDSLDHLDLTVLLDQ